jgi:hypothetical protein
MPTCDLWGGLRYYIFSHPHTRPAPQSLYTRTIKFFPKKLEESWQGVSLILSNFFQKNYKSHY